jgi:hypothetical protein
VFDYDPDVDAQREALRQARGRLGTGGR